VRGAGWVETRCGNMKGRLFKRGGPRRFLSVRERGARVVFPSRYRSHAFEWIAEFGLRVERIIPKLYMDEKTCAPTALWLHQL